MKIYYLKLKISVARKENPDISIFNHERWLPESPPAAITPLQEFEGEGIPWKVQAKVGFFKITISTVISYQIQLFRKDS